MPPNFYDYVPLLVVVKRGCCRFEESRLRVFDHSYQLLGYLIKNKGLGDFSKADIKDKIFDL